MKPRFVKRGVREIKYDISEIVFMERALEQTGQPKYRGTLVTLEVLPGDTYRVEQLKEEESGRFYVTTAHVS